MLSSARAGFPSVFSYDPLICIWHVDGNLYLYLYMPAYTNTNANFHLHLTPLVQLCIPVLCVPICQLAASKEAFAVSSLETHGFAEKGKFHLSETHGFAKK